MDDDPSMVPKKLLVRLNRDWKKKKIGFDFAKESFPKLTQIQRLHRTYRNITKSNTIASIKKTVKENMFYDGIPDEQFSF
jgi:hypothetical protein